jgi:hypothetical protein
MPDGAQFCVNDSPSHFLEVTASFLRFGFGFGPERGMQLPVWISRRSRAAAEIP